MKARTLGLVAVPIALTALAFLLIRAPERSGERARSTDPRAEPPTLPSGPMSPAARVPGGLDARAAAPEALATTAAADAEREAEAARLQVRVDGRALDLDDHPIEGAEVRLSDDTLVAVSDVAGAFDAPLELGPKAPILDFGWERELELSVSAPARRSASRRLPIQDGGTLHLGTVRLGAGGDAVGRVLDEDGAPLADAWVGWRDAAALPERDDDVDAAREEGIGLARDSDDAGPETWTDAEGRFHLRGLPEGEVFLLANDEGRLYAWSDVFALRAGDVVERTLVLPRDPRSREVRGRVLDPERRPAAHVQVGTAIDHWLEELGHVGRKGIETDASGRFETEVFVEDQEEARRLRLVAWDPAGRWYPSTPAPVESEVELVLQPLRTFEVRMIDAEGDPVPWGHVRFWGGGWEVRLLPDGGLVPLERAGRARVFLPREPFQLEAMAPGYCKTRTGPWDPARLPDPLVLTMTPGDTIRGRVTAEGRPLRGARVGLTLARDPAQVATSWDVAPLDRPFASFGRGGKPDGAETGRDGRFTTTLHDDGWHVVTVAADGYPETFLGPFEWRRGPGTIEVELTLERAGAIEGRLLVPPGGDPAGRIVGASNGWGFAWTAPADADGRFRIEGLAPGPYQLRACASPAASRQEYNARLPGPDAPPAELRWDCEVRPDETTRFDVDVRDEDDFVLAGSVRLGGRPLTGFAMLLTPEDSERSIALDRIDADGSFEMHLARGGRLTLLLRGEAGTFRQDLALAPGRTEWSAEIPTGTLERKGAKPRGGDGKELRLGLRWRRADGLTWSAWGLGDVQAVPAGTVELVHLHGRDRDSEGDVLRTIDIEPGAHVALDLDQPR